MLRIRKFGEMPCGYDARAFDISLHQLEHRLCAGYATTAFRQECRFARRRQGCTECKIVVYVAVLVERLAFSVCGVARMTNEELRMENGECSLQELVTLLRRL